jgi:hypothetical protein
VQLARYSPLSFFLSFRRKFNHRGHGGRTLTVGNQRVAERSAGVTRPSDRQALRSDHRASAADHQALTSGRRALTSDCQALACGHGAFASGHGAFASGHRALTSDGRASASDRQALASAAKAFQADGEARGADRGTLRSGSRALGTDGQACDAGGEALARPERASRRVSQEHLSGYECDSSGWVVSAEGGECNSLGRRPRTRETVTRRALKARNNPGQLHVVVSTFRAYSAQNHIGRHHLGRCPRLLHLTPLAF